jgi:hypothetical protein
MVRRYLPLDSVFQEATDEQIEELTRERLWERCNVESLKGLCDTVTRRRIAAIQRSSLLRSVDRQELVRYAKTGGVNLETRGRGAQMKLVFPDTHKELKLLVRLLSEDLYQGALSGQRFLSNSKRPFSGTS